MGTFPTGTEERRLWGRKSTDARPHLPNPSLQQGWLLPGSLAVLLGLGLRGACLPGLGSYWVQGDLSLALVLVEPRFAFTAPDLAWALITKVEDIFPYSPWEGHGLPEHQHGWDPRKDMGPPATPS